MEQFLLTLQPHGHILISWNLLQVPLSCSFFCVGPIGSALRPFTCLQRSCLITPCQKVNRRRSCRWMANLSLLPSRVCQSRLLTAPVVTLSPLITQPLFSADGNGEGFFSMISFSLSVSVCIIPGLLICALLILVAVQRYVWCRCFLLQKLNQSQWDPVFSQFPRASLGDLTLCCPQAADVWEIYPYQLLERWLGPCLLSQVHFSVVLVLNLCTALPVTQQQVTSFPFPQA